VLVVLGATTGRAAGWGRLWMGGGCWGGGGVEARNPRDGMVKGSWLQRSAWELARLLGGLGRQRRPREGRQGTEVNGREKCPVAPGGGGAVAGVPDVHATWPQATTSQAVMYDLGVLYMLSKVRAAVCSML
jgi:hypothetical protein